MHASGRRLVPISLLSVLLFALPIFAQGAEFDNGVTTYKDGSGDVVVDDGSSPLETLSDLEALPNRKAPESKERLSVDIKSLTILENESYISFILETAGPIYARAEYHYAIAGYARKVVIDTEPFDFMIVVNNKNATYLLWQQGDFTPGNNVSRVDIDSNKLNLTMHRSRFILKDRDTSRLIVAIAYLDQGGSGERISDRLIAREEKDDGGFRLTDAQILGLQIGFIVFVFIALFVVYGIWTRKKGQAITGGVCPKCEGRLDTSLNFCPSCGTVIRGPGSEPQESPPPPKPQKKKEE